MESAGVAGRKGPERHVPGEAGVWILIFGDMMVFALFFLIFTYYRAHDVTLYERSHRLLNERLGLCNTLLLLTSSWLVAMAVRCVRTGARSRAAGMLAAAALCGLGFIAIKAVEYGQKFAHGITVTTNDFFMYYFVFTAIHLMHVVIGLCVLGFLILHARRSAPAQGDMRLFESGAAFWHLVDLLWVVLFALLYLMA